jgi:alkylhydroperoxidase family enzyme
MQHIIAIDPQTATGTAKTLLDGVQRKLGFVPNLMRTLAVSPATLDAYLSFNDPRIAAALHFAQQVVRNQGHVSDEDVAEVRQAGYGDAEIAEIVGHVALNVLTNDFNTLAQTVVDF